MPTVSAIIPVFNRRDVLPRAVESVLLQTLGDFELIVVDDGSTTSIADSIAPALARPNVRIVQHETNRGAAAARNTGVHTAKGRYVAFLDSDDTWAAEKLERQLAFMQADVCASCTGFALVNDAGLFDRRMPPAISDLDEVLWGCRISPGSTLMVERAFYQAVGPMNETLQRLEDWDWMILAAKHAPFHGLREVLADVHHDRYAHVDEVKFVAAARRIANFVQEGRYELSRSQRAVLLSAIQYELSATYYRKRRIGPALRALAASFLYCPWKRPAHMVSTLKTVGADLKRTATGDR